MARVLTISGSPSGASRTAAVLSLAAHALTSEGDGNVSGHVIDTLHLRDLPAPALLRADFDHPDVRRTTTLVEHADALIIGTPVYKAAYSGLLKSWLDLLPQRALAGKAVLPLATGGSLAHALAVDYALRPVLSTLSAAHVARGCFVVDHDVTRATDSAPPALTPHARARLDRAVTDFAATLHYHHNAPIPASAARPAA